MSVVLVDVTRGGIVESRHRGHIAVTDGTGRVIASAGDPSLITYMRSAAKPLQALNVVLSGAADTFSLTEKELAIMCASHYGEEMHRETIFRILDKTGFSVDDLLCGAPLSISPEHMRKQLRENHALDNAGSDCSGKHCGFLAICKTKGYPVENYNSPDHPLQREVLETAALLARIEASEIGIGVDGCGVPVFAMPLLNMAAAFAVLTNPSGLEPPYRNACERIVSAMNAAPEMIAGTGGFCTEFLKHTNGRFCAKLGAEAVYCVGVKGRNLGIAVKIEDGSYRGLYAAVMSALIQMDLLGEQETRNLSRFIAPENVNDLGCSVGRISPCFTLEFS